MKVAAGASAGSYVNTIAVEDEPEYPGTWIWNVPPFYGRKTCDRSARVKKITDLGATRPYQSSATSESCFNHSCARTEKDGGIWCTSGVASLRHMHVPPEGRLTEEQMNNFRQEVHGKGLSSYPHPKLMPEFWQFPTVSMGLGPLGAIYQAKFLKYLEHRGLKDTSEQTVYAFLGDGEMDEPESKGAITIATREKLDNLVFVINCNLQRLDGPVTGNGKIINAGRHFRWCWLERYQGYLGGRDELLRKDTSKADSVDERTVDGDYQTFKSKDGA